MNKNAIKLLNEDFAREVKSIYEKLIILFKSIKLSNTIYMLYAI